MKRKIALFLSLLMLVTMLIPVSSFAASDEGLQNAIKIAKAKFDIPASFTKFNYNIYTEGDSKVWNLDWMPKDANGESISVAIDDKGNIKRYSHYRPFEYPYRKLPKISREDAVKKAEEFIKKVSPDMAKQVKLMENNQYPMMDYSYNFNFTRTVQGIPFNSNNISVEVNRDTGDVQNFYTNWTNDLVFPDPGKAITLDTAKKAYKEKMGVRLVYSSKIENEKTVTYSVYVPKYGNSYIDAFTGEKVEIPYDYSGPYYGGMGMGDMMNSGVSNAKAKNEEAVLSPEELKAIDTVSKLKEKEDVEKNLRGVKVLGLTDDFKANSVNLYKDWSGKDEFVWDINFIWEQQKGTNGDYQSVNARVNAKTGEIKSFYKNYPYNGEEKAKYNKDAVKAEVDSFLKDFQPEKFSNTEYDENYREYYGPMLNEDMPRQYAVRYIRKVNGLIYPNDYMMVRFDTVLGKIVSFDMNWSDMDFAPVEQVIPVENIYNTLFNDVGYELQYKMDFPSEYYLKFGRELENKKPQVRLVYGIKQTKPAVFDAKTGVILNYNGQPYKEIKPAEYKDIAGNYAEKQIKVLADFGISLDGTEFRPNESIKQKDFLRLVSKVFNNYYFDPYTTMDENKQMEEIYKGLIRDGIIKEAEKSPEAAVTREDCVKFLVRAMKYDKVADIKGIFNCSFKDKDKINPSLIGYVAIAEGLKIISGDKDGRFGPKDKLTRAQAAVILYNYLQI